MWGCFSPLATHCESYGDTHRKQETEADIIGMDLAARACYDPAAAAAVFKQLGQLEKSMGGDKMPEFLRTHPVRFWSPALIE